MDITTDSPETMPPGKRGVATVSQPNLECECLLAYAELLGLDVSQFEIQALDSMDESIARRDISARYNFGQLASAVVRALQAGENAA